MNGEMPKPVAWRYLSDYPRCVYYIAGTPADNAEFLYTADQMREFANEAMRQAMERAIEACENVEEKPWHGYENPNTFQDGKWKCMDAIRALSDVAAQEVGK